MYHLSILFYSFAFGFCESFKILILFDWFYYAQFFSYRRIFLLYSTCTHLRLFSEVSLHHTFYLAYTASNLIPWFLCLPYVPFLSLCGNVLRLHYTPTASLLLEGNQSLSKGCWEMLPIINMSHQQALYKYLLSRCLFRVTHTLQGMSVIFISWCWVPWAMMFWTQCQTIPFSEILILCSWY